MADGSTVLAAVEGRNIACRDLGQWFGIHKYLKCGTSSDIYYTASNFYNEGGDGDFIESNYPVLAATVLKHQNILEQVETKTGLRGGPPRNDEPIREYPASFEFLNCFIDINAQTMMSLEEGIGF